MDQKLIGLIVRELQDVLVDAADANWTTETKLYGEEGLLDSLRLVALIVAVEQAIEDEYGCAVTLADEKAMSLRHSPFRSIGSLADYAESLIKEAI